MVDGVKMLFPSRSVPTQTLPALERHNLGTGKPARVVSRQVLRKRSTFRPWCGKLDTRFETQHTHYVMQLRIVLGHSFSKPSLLQPTAVLRQKRTQARNRDDN